MSNFLSCSWYIQRCSNQRTSYASFITYLRRNPIVLFLRNTYSYLVSLNFEITVACDLKFHWYLRTLSLTFQKARTKIEVFLSLPCWLSRLKVSWFQNDFWMSSFEPKTNENISVFLPYLSKIGQIKKECKYRNIFVRFLVQMKTSKSHSEIIWPLNWDSQQGRDRKTSILLVAL
jgi:hypothetical protein